MKNVLERVGVSLDQNLLNQFDALIEKQGYVSRSEAVRDLIRAPAGPGADGQSNRRCGSGHSAGL